MWLRLTTPTTPRLLLLSPLLSLLLSVIFHHSLHTSSPFYSISASLSLSFPISPHQLISSHTYAAMRILWLYNSTSCHGLIDCFIEQCSNVQCCAVTKSTVQYSTALHIKVQQRRVQYSEVQYSARQDSNVQYSTANTRTQQEFKSFVPRSLSFRPSLY